MFSSNFTFGSFYHDLALRYHVFFGTLPKIKQKWNKHVHIDYLLKSDFDIFKPGHLFDKFLAGV